MKKTLAYFLLTVMGILLFLLVLNTPLEAPSDEPEAPTTRVITEKEYIPNPYSFLPFLELKTPNYDKDIADLEEEQEEQNDKIEDLENREETKEESLLPSLLDRLL